MHSWHYGKEFTPPYFPELRQAWLSFARSSYDRALVLAYNVTPGQRYVVDVVYASSQVGGSQYTNPVRLQANGQLVHDFMPRPDPMRRQRFTIPAAATAQSHTLVLACTAKLVGDWDANVRGCAIAELVLRLDQQGM